MKNSKNLFKHSISSVSTGIDWKKRFQKRKIIAGVIALLLSCFGFYLSYSLLDQKSQNAELVSVVIAKNFLPENTVILKEHIESKFFPRNVVPEGSMKTEEEVLGKTSQHIIAPNEIITSHALQKFVRENSLAGKIKNGNLALTLPEKWFQSPFPLLQIGDAVDIFASHKEKTFAETSMLVSGLPVIHIEKKQSELPEEITVSVSQEQAKQLLFAYTQNAKLLLTLTSF